MHMLGNRKKQVDHNSNVNLREHVDKRCSLRIMESYEAFIKDNEILDYEESSINFLNTARGFAMWDVDNISLQLDLIKIWRTKENVSQKEHEWSLIIT